MAVMRILALDTATEACSVALLAGDTLVARYEEPKRGHAELILPEIGRLLAAAGSGIVSLTAVVFGAGPGSFTGLRIACGVAQGLALARGLPVLGVGTLEALAEQSGAERVIACLDARMGEVYHAAYRRCAGGWTEASPPALMRPGDVPVPEEGGWVGCGARLPGPPMGGGGGALRRACGPSMAPPGPAPGPGPGPGPGCPMGAPGPNPPPA